MTLYQHAPKPLGLSEYIPHATVATVNSRQARRGLIDSSFLVELILPFTLPKQMLCFAATANWRVFAVAATALPHNNGWTRFMEVARGAGICGGK